MTPRSPMRRSGYFLCLTLLGICAALPANAQPAAGNSAQTPISRPAWTSDLKDDVRWIVSTPEAVIAASDKGFVGLDGATGRILWRKDDLDDPSKIALDLFPDPKFGLLRLAKGQRGRAVRIALNLETGEEIWNSTHLGLADVEHQFFVPHLGLLVLACTQNSKNPEHIVLGVDAATGKRLFMLDHLDEKEARHLLGPDEVMFDTDSTVVIPSEPPRKYRVTDGGLVWTGVLPGEPRSACDVLSVTAKPGEPPPERTDSRPLLTTVPSLLAANGERFFVVRGTHVQAFDAGDGTPAWIAPVELCGRCVQILETRRGLLCRVQSEYTSEDALFMLHKSSGRVLWQYPPPLEGFKSMAKKLTSFSRLSDAVAFGDSVYVVLNDKLVAFDTATGKKTEIYKVGFWDWDAFTYLTPLDDGFLAVGKRDLQWFDAKGNPGRTLHFEIPDDFGLGLAMLAAAVAMNQIPDVHLGRHVTLSFNASYTPALMRMLQDYSALWGVDDSVFMLVHLDEQDFHGSALAEIDRASGDVLMKLPVSKQPIVGFDRAHRRVYVASEHSILCYGR